MFSNHSVLDLPCYADELYEGSPPFQLLLDSAHQLKKTVGSTPVGKVDAGSPEESGGSISMRSIRHSNHRHRKQGEPQDWSVFERLASRSKQLPKKTDASPHHAHQHVIMTGAAHAAGHHATANARVPLNNTHTPTKTATQTPNHTPRYAVPGAILPSSGSLRKRSPSNDDPLAKLLEKASAAAAAAANGYGNGHVHSPSSLPSMTTASTAATDPASLKSLPSTTSTPLISLSGTAAAAAPPVLLNTNYQRSIPIVSVKSSRSASTQQHQPRRMRTLTDDALPIPPTPSTPLTPALSSSSSSSSTPPTTPMMRIHPMPATPPSSPPSSPTMTVQQRTSWILQTIDAQDPPLRASYSPLPARDAFEQDRLVTQHYVLRTAFDDQDYQAPMQPMLDQGCVALEIGCGPGTWSMEMSTAFPESTFIGLDLDTCFPNFIKPKNCHFRKCDITQLPLPLPDNSVDYIFHRDMNWALLAIQWPLLVKEYLRILRPGGWIECMEMDVETQSSRRLEQYINDHLMHSLRQRGQDPSIAKRLPSLLAIQGFRRVSSQFQSLPLGWGKAHQGKSQKRAHANTSSHPTPPNSSNSSNSANSANSASSAAATTLPTCSEFARAAGSLHTYTLQSLRPWLASNMACSLEKYDAWLERVPAEWADAHTYVNWHAVVAQKPF